MDNYFRNANATLYDDLNIGLESAKIVIGAHICRWIITSDMQMPVYKMVVTETYLIDPWPMSILSLNLVSTCLK